MAVNKTTYLYEVLIRFDRNGVVGAHAIDAEIAEDTDTGEVYRHEAGDPRAIGVDDIDALLSQTTLAAVQDNINLRMQNTALMAQIKQLMDQLA